MWFGSRGLSLGGDYMLLIGVCVGMIVGSIFGVVLTCVIVAGTRGDEIVRESFRRKNG